MTDIEKEYNEICNKLTTLYDTLYREQISIFVLNPTINELVGKINVLEDKKKKLEELLNGEE